MEQRPDSEAVSTPAASAYHTPLPGLHERDPFLEPPRASYLTSDQRDSYASGSLPNSSQQAFASHGTSQQAFFSKENSAASDPERKKSRKGLWIFLALLAIAIVVVAVVVPVYFTVIKPRQNNAASDNNPSDSAGDSIGSGDDNPQSPSGATSGTDGSEILMEDGSKFTYTNKFGGIWVQDPQDPFNNNARPNSWTPPLNTSWDFGKDRINGVNLGGLFVLEPFISPALFQKYPGSVDEWTISELMAADTASGGLNQLEEHYKTFITEKDLAEIAGAGLNWVRLPIPFWAIETWPSEGEPFLARTCWPYILKVIGWARKYGLRVNLDLHTIPGSQNGYNHSGKLGQANFMYGPMGIANAQRALEYIRILTEFFSQPQYKDVVVMFGIVNEALVQSIGQDQMTSFYREAHDMMRKITGFGAGNGPYISVHDGFIGIGKWGGFLPGSDRFIMDTHPYFAFDGSPNNDQIATSADDQTAGGVWPERACSRWAASMNTSRVEFGVTVAGEWSNGFNDCGLFLKGTQESRTSYGGNCADFADASQWNTTLIAGLKQLALAQMDSFGDYFFWTWKIGNSSTSNRVEAPLWSYQLGLQNGWMPTDPREAIGKCASVGVTSQPWDGSFQPWATGGAGAGTISNAAQYPWPPATLSGVGGGGETATLLPSYTATGSVVTLPPPTLTPSPTGVDLGSGWFNTQDTASAPTPVSGCQYQSAWDASGSPAPATACGAANTAVV